ncbi:hypothetical protein AV530_004813 [Patagioenas fasciata monilis]|uniref:Uncharacterized protein n=1 Tax=Patagioenas fasciata monilis TaxID=372326 RepID=A0A1V4KE34_PATFA|nr:hypothetical protein AV530_004813 [Patagioenas fasciata monilis]
MVPRMGELRTPRLGGSPGELEIRSDTCRILEETIPLIKDKLMEMYHICAKADKLEAFVKMVAHCVSFVEDQT